MNSLKTGISLVAVAIAGFLAWQIYKKGKALTDVADNALTEVKKLAESNPVSRAVDKVVQVVTGDPLATAGGTLWEKLNAGKVAAERALSGPIAPRADPKKLIAQWTTFDQEDAEAGALMRGLPLLTAADQDDADDGARFNAGAYLDYSKLARGARRNG